MTRGDRKEVYWKEIKSYETNEEESPESKGTSNSIINPHYFNSQTNKTTPDSWYGFHFR